MSKTNTLLKRIQSRHSRGSDGLGGSSEFIVLAVLSLETDTIDTDHLLSFAMVATKVWPIPQVLTSL